MRRWAQNDNVAQRSETTDLPDPMIVLLSRASYGDSHDAEFTRCFCAPCTTGRFYMKRLLKLK